MAYFACETSHKTGVAASLMVVGRTASSSTLTSNDIANCGVDHGLFPLLSLLTLKVFDELLQRGEVTYTKKRRLYPSQISQPNKLVVSQT